MNEQLIIIIIFLSRFSENERQYGFVLIIDRRSDRWMSVKSIMTYIEVNSCNLITLERLKMNSCFYIVTFEG